ncbi:hypothetical protein HGRIS_007254 [Hohenbuehelia grisea]|uniref:Uncharacterized protein n=1 Tax=Hohenbuehelia grisea TaxID=104357 RepID=A0ABR3JC86_9AGAR
MSTTSSGITQSTEFWAEGEGSAIFLVENTFFPQPENPEGTTIENPLVLPGVIAKEWEDFLSSCIHPRPPEYWINIIKLASLYQIHHMVTKASYKLPAYDDEVLPPAKRLYIARVYHVPDLVDSGFRSLCHINKPLSLMPDQDLEDIGFRGLSILARTKEKIELVRKKVAITAPEFDTDVHDKKCLDHHACWRAWKLAWWTLFGSSILQPTLDAPWIPELWAFEVNHHMSKAVGVLPGCRSKMIEGLGKERQDLGEPHYRGDRLGNCKNEGGVDPM